MLVLHKTPSCVCSVKSQHVSNVIPHAPVSDQIMWEKQVLQLSNQIMKLLLTLRMQPGQQAYHRYRYAEPAGRLYVRATGSRSCAEMAAEANVGQFLQHVINTPHYRDTLVVLGNETKNAASLVHSPLRFFRSIQK